ncbi:hypothetical protein [Nitrobacter hamburgensis]|uniref:hypothetical protein n=1 Tax=Nitrobacter hamburgensis TaxID=912 RepID=UPI001FD91298|nr:hypothetical protein [Nitrobacter hamburgensis]
MLGLLFVADWIWPGNAGTDAHPATVASAGSAGLKSEDLVPKDSVPKDPASTDLGAASAVLSSIDDWRRSEKRFERSKHDPQPIVYPDIATLAPTADRLQWERQLRYLPANHVYEARAEMPKAEAPKVAEKTRPPRKHIAHARSRARVIANVERPPPPRYARNTGWNPFGLFD